MPEPDAHSPNDSRGEASASRPCDAETRWWLRIEVGEFNLRALLDPARRNRRAFALAILVTGNLQGTYNLTYNFKKHIILNKLTCAVCERITMIPCKIY